MDPSTIQPQPPGLTVTGNSVISTVRNGTSGVTLQLTEDMCFGSLGLIKHNGNQYLLSRDTRADALRSLDVQHGSRTNESPDSINFISRNTLKRQLKDLQCHILNKYKKTSDQRNTKADTIIGDALSSNQVHTANSDEFCDFSQSHPLEMLTTHGFLPCPTDDSPLLDCGISSLTYDYVSFHRCLQPLVNGKQYLLQYLSCFSDVPIMYMDILAEVFEYRPCQQGDQCLFANIPTANSANMSETVKCGKVGPILLPPFVYQPPDINDGLAGLSLYVNKLAGCLNLLSKPESRRTTNFIHIQDLNQESIRGCKFPIHTKTLCMLCFLHQQCIAVDKSAPSIQSIEEEKPALHKNYACTFPLLESIALDASIKTCSVDINEIVFNVYSGNSITTIYNVSDIIRSLRYDIQSDTVITHMLDNSQ